MNSENVGGKLKESGYSQEEEYFYKLNKELIEKKRKQLDETRKSTATDKSSEAFWMNCPKCGNKLKEENLVGITIDRCSGCNGIFFDNGELELLLDSQEPKGFLTSVRKAMGL